jgi:hypothetical protein
MVSMHMAEEAGFHGINPRLNSVERQTLTLRESHGKMHQA